MSLHHFSSGDHRTVNAVQASGALHRSTARHAGDHRAMLGEHNDLGAVQRRRRQSFVFGRRIRQACARIER